MRRLGYVLGLAALFMLLASGPKVAQADSRVFPTGYWGPLLSCTGNYIDPEAAETVSDKKACTDFCDLLHTGQNVVDFAMTLVVFVGAPAMLTFGGIMLMIAGSGGDEKRQMAKDVIVSAVVGIGITLGAYLILSTFLWVFGNGPNSEVRVSWPDIQCEVPE